MTKQFIIMAQPKRKDGDLETGKPMSYGRDNEPVKDELLFRGRATQFDNQAAAFAALQISLAFSESRGSTWPKKFQYFLVEIV